MESHKNKTEILEVKYLVDKNILTIPTTICSRHDNNDELESLYFKVIIENIEYISDASDTTEKAVYNLQKILLPNIRIMCCQSCIHGNFCPFGDNDDEVFCFKDKRFNNKHELCDQFGTESYPLRSHRLLDYCDDYKPLVGNSEYVYNSWDKLKP
jgi:hypothetical protein